LDRERGIRFQWLDIQSIGENDLLEYKCTVEQWFGQVENTVGEYRILQSREYTKIMPQAEINHFRNGPISLQRDLSHDVA
jgi:hypothetical protein